ncbi:MAG: hypothetical protein HZA06_01510 [Nitrospirae bacterium]|nr:hypothetical protein [Nitrospirota bacterium]
MKIVLLVFGISFAIIGVLHFAIPKKYHEWYNMIYNANDPFDITAAKTIGLWAFTNSIIAFWAFVSYERNKTLLIFLMITCFGFIFVHIPEFINGLLPWPFAIMLALVGVILIVLK